jgi:hypothetical protein
MGARRGGELTRREGGDERVPKKSSLSLLSSPSPSLLAPLRPPSTCAHTIPSAPTRPRAYHRPPPRPYSLGGAPLRRAPPERVPSSCVSSASSPPRQPSLPRALLCSSPPRAPARLCLPPPRARRRRGTQAPRARGPARASPCGRAGGGQKEAEARYYPSQKNYALSRPPSSVAHSCHHPPPLSLYGVRGPHSTDDPKLLPVGRRRRLSSRETRQQSERPEREAKSEEKREQKDRKAKKQTRWRRPPALAQPGPPPPPRLLLQLQPQQQQQQQQPPRPPLPLPRPSRSSS